MSREHQQQGESIAQRHAREVVTAGTISAAVGELLVGRTMKDKRAFVSLVSGVAHYNETIMPDISSPETVSEYVLMSDTLIHRTELSDLIDEQLAIEVAQDNLMRRILDLSQ